LQGGLQILLKRAASPEEACNAETLFISGASRMAKDYLFSSESVSEGHPDKVADQISDAILDAIFTQDKYSRVAAETLVNTGLVVLAGAR